MTEYSPHLISAVRRLRRDIESTGSTTLSREGVRDDIRDALDALPDEVKNPRYELPQVPSSSWEDDAGRMWVTDSVLNWYYNGDKFEDAEVARYLPFTRLVPNRPNVTEGMVIQAVGEADRRWTRDSRAWPDAFVRALQELGQPRD
jgi:hypothetical protein